jgi:hypothetical protein
MQMRYRAASFAGVSPAPPRRAPRPAVPIAGSWPVLERIPRRRFLRMRRNGRIASAAGALVIAVLIGVFVEHHSALVHVITAAAICAWVLAITWTFKQRWLRWLRDDFAAEVSAKMDGIRRAAPFN